MAEHYIFQIENLSKLYNRKEVLKNIWLAFYPGAKIGVIGSNGAGKSTLLRIMALQDTDFMGTARAHEGISIGYVPQEPKLTNGKTVLENIEEAVAPTRKMLKRHEEIGELMGDPNADFDKLMEEMSRLQDKIDACNAWELDRQLEIAMDAMRLPPSDALVDKLSGGERRRVALCKMLLQKPDLLLLDEPTNHLDAESVFWLEKHLKEYPGTVVSVTHDRYFLDNVAEWILELDRGSGYPFKGNYTSWMEQKKARLEKEEKTESARQKALARELEWVRTSPKGRLAKNKARLTSYEKLASQAYEEREDDLQIQIPPGNPLGDLVVRAEGLTKGFGDRVLFDNLSFDLPKGGIVGVIGPNGAGKTTLFRMIVGQEKPDKGTLRIGDKVEVAYVDQHRDHLADQKTVFEEVANGLDFMMLGKQKVPSRGYLSRFNFKGPDQQRKVGELSGGERNRVHLAKLLRSGGNLLLLDEPTNDLDVDTLRALEEALINFGGCAVVISHDRWFLDRISTHILAFESDGVYWCEGNYKTYEEMRRVRLGEAADRPTKVIHKKLMA
ncbi:energy-dependent translational throttle protein EttA [Telmatocola sphagniphila]|uniref:Energy-dependent translational throttle protein EttA n=1 Tax=Telmatocola sphagniphila TaxID=1123043 RepID=A0A8E6EZ12_9BACT|nr:energy-dependent translational throttle protein EttA [Telmatocola sphagniphila]QVL32936.1 energy-dependent translational throttle protein EttA [Telmatocola sphagniphila]